MGLPLLSDRMMWQPNADHEQKQELGDVTITRGLDATRPIKKHYFGTFFGKATRLPTLLNGGPTRAPGPRTPRISAGAAVLEH